MERIAFQLRIKPGMTAEYDDLHRHVWPELLAELESFGVSEYSIFRRGQQLFLHMHVSDYGELVKRLAASEINRRWQERASSLFEPVLDLQPGEAQAMMQEVFFMPGKSTTMAIETVEEAR